VVLRILADDSASVCRLGLKFGAPLSEVRHLLTVARDLGLAVAGVSYHVGSGNGSVQAFGDAVRDARSAFDIAASLGLKLTLLDIGGGFPGSEMGAASGGDRLPARELDAANPYATAPSFTSIASVVRAALDTHFPEGCGVTLIAEPGRYFVKSSHVLAVNVIGKRRTSDDDGAPRINYYVNDGLYGSFNCVLYDHVTCAPSLLLTNGDAALAAAAASQAQSARARLSAHDDVIASLGPDGTPLVADALGLGAAAQLGSVAAAVAEASHEQQSQSQVVRRVMTADGRVEEVAEAVTAAAGGPAVGGGHASGQPALVRSAAGGAGRASAASSPRWSFRSLERDLATEAASAPSASAQPYVFNTTVWGPTCDSMDKVSDTLALPELAVGDWLVYENMGAYTIAGSCRFNGFPLTTKVYIDTDGSLDVTPEEA
jgi:diaminopimelate decarboxylase